jgi:hypothetical protein
MGVRMAEETPLAEPIEEARRVLSAAEREGVNLRLLGGLAVRMHAGDDLPPGLRREYPDLDFVTSRSEGGPAGELLERLGYEANRRFNALQGSRRLIFYDRVNDRHVDVFVGRFEMCHRIPLEERLEADSPTIPLADLLLTKLQVMRLNHKDAVDVTAILLHHDVGPADEETVNQDYIADLLAKDWGLWRTTRGNVEAIVQLLASLEVPDSDRQIVAGRLERLWAHVESAPKSRRWRARARIGDRVQWYEEPEEIAHDK